MTLKEAGKNLNKLRNEKGFSVEEMKKETDLDFNKLERDGLEHLDMMDFFRIANAFEMKASALFKALGL